MIIKVPIIYDSENSYPIGGVSFWVGEEKMEINIDGRKIQVSADIIDILCILRNKRKEN